MANISSRLMKGSAWLSASRAIVNALSILSTIVLARLLVPADFGLVALATTMLMIISSVTELSLPMALVRHAAPTRSHFDAVWTLSALRGLVLGILFAASGPLMARIYADPRLTAIMVALGGSIFLGGLTNPRSIMLQRNLIFWQEFVLTVAQKLAGFVVSVAIAYYYRTYWALVIGTVAMQFTNVLVSYTILPFRPRICFAHVRELMSFSIWLTAGQIVNTLNWRFDYLLLGKGLGVAELGHYSVGSNLAQTPTRETTAPLTKVIFPGFSSIRNDRERLAAAYQRAQAFVTAVALPAGIGTALIADPLIRLTMGEKWVPVIFVIQVLASVFALQTLGSLCEPLGMAHGETRLLFIRNLQMLFIRMPLIVIGMLVAGLQGVVIARVVSGLISIYFYMRLVRRFTDLSLREQLAANSRAFISVAVMAAGVTLLSPYLAQGTDTMTLIVKIATIVIVAGALYCGTSLLLWTLQRQPPGPEREIQQLIAKIFARGKPA
ncbi:MAG TPA: lipopolysaccharide biosynthesis protein [Povalibacter sp.]|jgi:O-antigen/teichoic acid export membrane protein|nr:lipopolysaccharide biosynthesis protein [Povalibacter sp.]